MLNKPNLILMTDSYKLSHWKQYPKQTTKIYSYLEARGSENKAFDSTVFFGLQYYLKLYLEGEVITQNDVNEADSFCLQHFGKPIFNKSGWEYIVNEHGGHLPLKIKAVKEGTLVQVHNALLTIENTDPECFWLTNFVETLLMKVWYTCTIATNSFYSKLMLRNFLDKTYGDLSGLDFKLHDFGYRGVSSEEQAGLGAMAHLINFKGTDTLAGIRYAQEFYNSDEMIGFSVPASEHSTITSWGKENEYAAIKNMLNTYPEGIVSCVADSYDIYNFVDYCGTELREDILNRNGTFVFRPDSGNLIDVNLKIVDMLWKYFGGTKVKGYRVLDPHVRILQGDGIHYDSLEWLLINAKEKGYSTENWVFGSGGGLLQRFNRDSFHFAIKASYGEKIVDGKNESFEIYKDPITSRGKRSKKGKVKLYLNENNQFKTAVSSKLSKQDYDLIKDELELVFENGKMKREQSFEEVRAIATQYLNLL